MTKSGQRPFKKPGIIIKRYYLFNHLEHSFDLIEECRSLTCVFAGSNVQRKITPQLTCLPLDEPPQIVKKGN